ncbi:cyclin-D4-2-like [Amaranthus tricolor]|uniref:cyclin-D4-2-like n=1 Tax=Amaranthus tricolor TaxID=29722 RepID=UPI00258731BA|nr:cyclin-D4-2-like [Amaranthus tricolor]
MADIFDIHESSSLLLCDENKDLCFDDLDDEGDVDGDCGSIDDVDDYHHHKPPKKNNIINSIFNEIESQPSIHFPEQSDELFALMLEKENEYFPQNDYLNRLRCGELDLSIRIEALDWIFKAHSYYSFGPLSLCLAVNYLDRFLATKALPSGKAWAVQLLAVACLSIAVKLEETSVPQSVGFQVGDPKFVFEAKTIQRMELFVLDTLNWKMNAVTPCSFLDYSLKKLCDAHNENTYLSSSSNVVNRSMELISCTIKGIDFLEFKSSEIAAAVAVFVTAEIQALDIDMASSCFIHLEKGRVLKCVEMMKNNSVINRKNGGIVGVVPQSPIGVLEAGSFSYKSDELTATTVVGSCANSSQNTITRSPATKRIKLDTTSRMDS